MDDKQLSTTRRAVYGLNRTLTIPDAPRTRKVHVERIKTLEQWLEWKGVADLVPTAPEVVTMLSIYINGPVRMTWGEMTDKERAYCPLPGGTLGRNAEIKRGTAAALHAHRVFPFVSGTT